MDASRKRVLLVEDHEVVGEGLKALLSSHFDILGPIRDGGEVIEAVRTMRPDAMVLDISLPGRNGLDLLPELHKEWPRLPIVMLTGAADFLVGRTAMVLGALGFLPKDSGVDELELALRTALAGKKYLSPRLPPPPKSVNLDPLPPAVSQLTPRQLMILRLIGSGAETDQIAEELKVSAHTVHFHRRNLRRALGIESDHGLTRVAAMFNVREELQ
jgi:DNA-binding NarL/FixJ family response regulator